jgi:hypothetical protein
MIDKTYRDLYKGSLDTLNIIDGAIKSKTLLMVFYKTRLGKTQNYIILPVNFRVVSTRAGRVTLMLLAKQPSKHLRIVQLVMNRVYAVQSYVENVGDTKSKFTLTNHRPVNETRSRKSFSIWGHFGSKNETT